MALRILIVDDNEVIRAMLRHVVTKLGHEVAAEAATGAEAVAAFAAAKPGLVTLDISLPDMDGLAVLSRLRAIDPAAKVIVITGNNSAVLEKDVRAAGALAVVHKPFDLAGLRRLIDGVDGGEP
ncbi:MAG: response regulator [Elusimicrobia bacterium]|nr:response regulator [Elusimicrobiota bacterium]